tara:strand:+ start:3059 stop:3652 length:594 start_codon:yes stop_codon:yes gene_type:complete
MSSRVEEVKLWVSSFLNLKNDFEMERIRSNNIDILIPLENPLENIPTETYLFTRELVGGESGCYAYLINLNKNLVKKIINSPIGYREEPAWNFISFKGDDLEMCGKSTTPLSVLSMSNQVKRGFINTLDNLFANRVWPPVVKKGGGYHYTNHEFDILNRNGYHFTWYMENYAMYKIIQSEKKFDFLNWDKEPWEDLK